MLTIAAQYWIESLNFWSNSSTIDTASPRRLFNNSSNNCGIQRDSPQPVNYLRITTEITGFYFAKFADAPSVAIQNEPIEL